MGRHSNTRLHLVLLFSILLISSSVTASAFGQKPTTSAQMSDLDEFIDFNNPLNSNPNPLSPGFTILVNSTIYPLIQTSLDQYCSDVNLSGYSAKLVIGICQTIDHVRAILKGEWINNGSTAAVLVGSFPIPWFNLSVGAGTGWEYFPCDLFYMDLDGSWADTNGDGNFETHTGNVAADIIFGRLPAYILTGNEAQLLNNYFYKNHLYRTGQLKLPNKNLVYVDDDWFGSAEGWKSDAEICYENVTLEKNGVTTCAQDYKKRLVQDYEFIQIHCHANHKATRHNFKVGGVLEGEDVNSTDIKNIDPHTFFSILFTCGSANYSVPDFLAGWYTFTDTYGLASISSSRVGGMLNYDDFYKPLSANKSIGEAFKDWFVVNAESSKSWFYGMTLIGDPLLVPNQYDLEFEDITFSDPNPYSDETVYIHTKVKSQLDNCSGINVSLYDGNPSSGGQLVSTQIADFGWNRTLELNFSWVATSGIHDFWVVVDQDNILIEINETNNIGHRSLEVYEARVVELSSNTNVVYSYDNLNLSGFVYGGIGVVEGYYFDFGDGNNSGWLTENYTNYNYSDNGVYYVTLKVVDSNNYYTMSEDLEIHVLNRPPVAIIETDLTENEILQVKTDEVINFNGLKSYDLDGTISSYYWDFGDTKSEYGMEVNHSYSTNGNYMITLHLLDDDYGSDDENISIFVTNRFPVAVAEVDNEIVFTDEILTFTAENSYDVDGDIDSYLWEFGDGNKSNYLSPLHKYSDNGNYSVTLKIIDDDGDESFAAIHIEVLNRPPTSEISCSSYIVYTNDQVYFNATVIDPDGYIVSSGWDFGDGTNAAGLTVVHEFVNDGSYTINFTALDDDGAGTSAGLVVTVLNVAPEAKFTFAPIDGNTSTVYTFNSSSMDVDGSVTNYTWDLGDGNVSYGSSIISHQYSLPGNYTVILTIKDDDGAMTEFKIYLNVKIAPVIKPPDDPEPEINKDDNRSKDRNEENDLAAELMIIGISIVIIIIIIILAIFFIIYHKKRGGDEGQLPPFEEPSDEAPGSELNQHQESEPEIDWDDED
jgi:PKD repeat protein